MTEQDRRRFAKALAMMGEVYQKEIHAELAEIYFKVLADVDIAELERASIAILRTQKFFPKPSELLEIIEGVRAENRRDKEVEANRLAEETKPSPEESRWNYEEFKRRVTEAATKKAMGQ